ncbi:MAG TPA: DUF2066 domain-containing protein [Candidatus Saccharimonadia bacterium]|nr:DUF2066 domain-containing protein [Candidatus Saccharimonadia bacterium]
MRSPLLLALALAAAPPAWPQASPPVAESPVAKAAPAAAPPPTLVWLVIDDGTRKTIASAAQVAALGAMTGAAAERGIELRFPTLDGSDLARVDADTLWSGDPRKALAAAKRYGTPATLIARLSRAGSLWQGRMTLVDAYGKEDYVTQHAESSNVLAFAAAGLADRLSKRQVVAVARVVGDHYLWIAGLRSAADYARALKYLQSLPVVEALAPEGAEGDRLLVKARLNVLPERLAQVLSLGDTMRVDDEPPPRGSEAVLHFLR